MRYIIALICTIAALDWMTRTMARQRKFEMRRSDAKR